jgi:hypothetical protein
VPHRISVLPPSDPATQNRRSPRTRYLRPGNSNLARIRKAPLHERASVALGGMFGPAVRELTYCLAEGVKRGTIDGGVAKLILARVLPSSRPVQIDLPHIATGADLIEAENKIAEALNDGRISPQEARTRSRIGPRPRFETAGWPKRRWGSDDLSAADRRYSARTSTRRFLPLAGSAGSASCASP